MERQENNIVWHPDSITRQMRERRNNHRASLVWLTGLSGAGKSTLAQATQKHLFAAGYQVFVLDGDNLRHGLCAGLGFSNEDRSENIRRTAEAAKLFLEAGFIVLAAFISPMIVQRERVREVVGQEDMLEVYCRCSLDVCTKRDPKGLYRRALTGEIKEFTGVSSPYEPPVAPALTLDTDQFGLDIGVERILRLLVQRDIIDADMPILQGSRTERLQQSDTLADSLLDN